MIFTAIFLVCLCSEWTPIGDIMRITFVYDAVYPWVKGGAEKEYMSWVFVLSQKVMKCTSLVLNGGKGQISSNMMACSCSVCKSRELYVERKKVHKCSVAYSIKLFPHLGVKEFELLM